MTFGQCKVRQQSVLRLVHSSFLLLTDVFSQYHVNAGLPGGAGVLEKRQNFADKPDRRRNLARPMLLPALTRQFNSENKKPRCAGGVMLR